MANSKKSRQPNQATQKSNVMKTNLSSLALLLCLCMSLCQVAYSQSTSRVYVDYGTDLAAMIKTGKYCMVDDSITSQKFPLSGTGKVGFVPKIFKFDRVISQDDVLEQMKKEGFQPAKIEELLAYVAKNPEANPGGSLIALGSVVEYEMWDGDASMVKVSWLGKPAQHYIEMVTIAQKSHEWTLEYAFLGVRK